MKKKEYLQPFVEVISVNLYSPIQASPGWAKDGNPPTDVYQEENNFGDEYYEGDGSKQDEDGFFLDLD